jgi:hypothetical protein
MAGSSNDDHAAATANIRETVKWLIAAFAAPLAILVGTGPLASFTPSPPALVALAAVAAVIGLACVLYAIKRASDILVMRPFFLSDVQASAELSGFVNAHAADVLPSTSTTLAEFLKQRKENIEALQQETDDAKVRALTADYNVYAEATGRIVKLCNFERTRAEFEALRSQLLILAVVGILSATTFTWIASGAGSSKTNAAATCPTGAPVAR